MSDPRAVSRRKALALAGMTAVTAAGMRADVPSTATGRWSPGLRTLVTVVSAPMPNVVMTALDLKEGADGVRTLVGLIRSMERLAGTAQLAVGLGASWFTKSGLEAWRPRGLTTMPSFTGDVLSAGPAHGDLLVQVAAPSAERAWHAAASLEDSAAGAGVRWRKRGFRSENTIEGGRALTRNLFGFVEGHGNPSLQDGRNPREIALVAAGAGEPDWAVGGSYQVVRIIRFASRRWDAEPPGLQERIIGRRRDGRWLDGRPATGRPGFASDPDGMITPLNAHARLANPRTPGAPAPRMLRRSYSYGEGGSDEGLLFVAFQADLESGFAGVQRRLAGEPLSRYTLTIGGGYYFVPDLSRELPFGT